MLRYSIPLVGWFAPQYLQTHLKRVVMLFNPSSNLQLISVKWLTSAMLISSLALIILVLFLSCMTHMSFVLHVILSTCRLYPGIYHLMLPHSLVATFGQLCLMLTCSKWSDIR